MVPSNDFETILGFSDDDLEANRRGQLTDRQIAARKQTARSSAFGCLGFLLIAAVFALALLVILFNTAVPDSQRGGSLQPLSVVLLAVPLLVCLLIALLIVNAVRAAYFPATPTLDRQSGTIVRGNPTKDGKHYEVSLNGVSFKVPKAAYDLIDPATVYVVYRALYSYGRLSVYSDDDNNQIIAIEQENRDVVVPQNASNLKSPIDYEQDQLQQLFGFSADDLGANRSGQLSQRQVDQLHQSKGNGVGSGIFYGLLTGVIVGAVLTAITENLPTAAFFAVIAFAAVFALAVWNARHAQAALTQSLRRGVTTAHGPAAVRISKVQHHGDHPYVETVYHVKVGETEFKVPEKVYYAFREGYSYNIYFVKTLHNRIVSAEQIG